MARSRLVRTLFVAVWGVALVSPAADAAVTGTVTEATAPAEAPLQTYAAVTLETGGKTYAHPGFFANIGEESTFSFEIGGKAHDVTVGITGDEDKGYDVHVVYKRGSHVVLSGDGHVVAGGTHEIKKGSAKVIVKVDPHGHPDHTRKRRIEGPGGENPLD